MKQVYYETNFQKRLSVYVGLSFAAQSELSTNWLQKQTCGYSKSRASIGSYGAAIINKSNYKITFVWTNVLYADCNCKLAVATYNFEFTLSASSRVKPCSISCVQAN